MWSIHAHDGVGILIARISPVFVSLCSCDKLLKNCTKIIEVCWKWTSIISLILLLNLIFKERNSEKYFLREAEKWNSEILEQQEDDDQEANNSPNYINSNNNNG